MNSIKTLEDELYLVGLVGIVLAIIGSIVYFKIYPIFATEMVCSFYKSTGFYCPGCGGTRASIALVHGHILRSFYFHPMVLYALIIYGGFMTTHTFEKLHIGKCKGWKFKPWFIYAGLFLFVGNWVLKNVLLIAFHMQMPLA